MIDLHAPGAKDDAAKPRPALVLGAFWPAIIAQVRQKPTPPAENPGPMTLLLDAVANDNPLGAVRSALSLFVRGDGAGRPDAFLRNNRNALEAAVEVGTFGARKYSPDGWLRVPDGTNRYKDALVRHLLGCASGAPVDTDSKMPHEWHIMWNALAWHTLVILAQVRADDDTLREGK